jgi:hypothetical protein
MTGNARRAPRISILRGHSHPSFPDVSPPCPEIATPAIRVHRPLDDLAVIRRTEMDAATAPLRTIGLVLISCLLLCLFPRGLPRRCRWRCLRHRRTAGGCRRGAQHAERRCGLPKQCATRQLVFDLAHWGLRRKDALGYRNRPAPGRCWMRRPGHAAVSTVANRCAVVGRTNRQAAWIAVIRL